VLLWLVHMCVPPTPLFCSSAECAVISNQENRTNVPEEFEQNPTKVQAGRPNPGRPAYILHQNCRSNSPRIDYTEPAHPQKGHEDWPQVQAGRPILGVLSMGVGRPHLSSSLREPLRGAGSIPLLPYPSCFRSKVTLIKFK